MWAEFYRNGGAGMIPTTVFGFLLVAAGALLLMRPERRYVPLTVTLGFLTLTSGFLGCTVGIINTFRYLQKVPVQEQTQIAALGCAESLNNVVLALIIVTFTALLASIGAFRALRRSRVEAAA